MFRSQPPLGSSSGSRSMGVKLLLLCGLALLMTIPSFFVSSLVADRAARAADVTQEISIRAGGPQTFLGPTLAIPYTISPQSPATATIHGVYLVFPERASARLRTSTTEWHKSLFRVPVYQAGLQLDADFTLHGVPAAAPANAQLDWSRAEIIVGVTNPRGALADPTITRDGQSAILAPAQVSDDLSLYADEKKQVNFNLFGTPAANVRPEAAFHVSSRLKFSGAERIAILAYGRTTHVTAEGDWRNPGFAGALLPVSHAVSNQGFTAQWSVPFLARTVRAEGSSDSVNILGTMALGLSFLEATDPYQWVQRSLKYALLFLSLVFLSYFVFETTTSKRLHPAQYLLVGVAQIIFYLLLLSLAERTGFDLGFALAAGATVGLLSMNAGWVFDNRQQGMRALLVFAPLYGLIYLLLRLEDYALLVGALTSFLAVTAVMYVTRNKDWYTSDWYTSGPVAGASGLSPATATPPVP